MNTQMALFNKEYTVSFSEENEVIEKEINQISIEGYQVLFDKKVMATPIEVIADNRVLNSNNLYK